MVGKRFDGMIVCETDKIPNREMVINFIFLYHAFLSCQANLALAKAMNVEGEIVDLSELSSQIVLSDIEIQEGNEFFKQFNIRLMVKDGKIVSCESVEDTEDGSI